MLFGFTGNLCDIKKLFHQTIIIIIIESSITKILESLPGIDQLYTYTFKHGKFYNILKYHIYIYHNSLIILGGTPLMDVPLAENPSGCARCEPCFRTLVKRKHRPIISNSPKKNDEKIYASEEAVISREGRGNSKF